MSIAKIYIFDMDHTLINIDCDVSWKSYGVKHHIAPANAMAIADKFFDDYNDGVLDHDEFMKFQLQEFIGKSEAEMAVHSQAHFEEFIRPNIYEKALELVKSLHKNSIPVAILSATNNILVKPVADWFGIKTIMGTTLEVVDGLFTGRIIGEYGAKEGKIAPAKLFAQQHGYELDAVSFYGDSINDSNVLDKVGFPVAANPSDELKKLALEKGWDIINFNR